MRLELQIHCLSSAEQNMGLNPARSHDLNIAKLIIKTKNEILA